MRAGGGVVIIKDIIYGPFNYVERNDYFKILIECVWGNDGCGGGGVSFLPINTTNGYLKIFIGWICGK